MARLARWFLPDVPQHIIQRGNNRQNVFFGREDFRRYRGWLADIAADHRLAVHAYVLMTNHVHLLATPANEDSIPRTMQALGRRYVAWVNRRHGRTGSLWEGRYRATVVDGEAYLLKLMRYIELNPVRARMVAEPGAYPWSSHRATADGAVDSLVTPHPLYLALGDTAAARQAAYRDLFADVVSADEIGLIRGSLNTGWALGSDDFKATAEQQSGRRAARAKVGRKCGSKGGAAAGDPGAAAVGDRQLAMW